MLKKLLCAVCLSAFSANVFAVNDIWKDKLFIDGEVRSFAIFDRDAVQANGAAPDYNEVPTRVLFGAGYRITPDINVFARGAFFTVWGTTDGQYNVLKNYNDKLNFVEGYVEFKNIFNGFDVKLGRQFYYSDDVFYKPLLYSVERLIYASVDGVSASLKYKDTNIKFLAGKEAELIYGGFPEDRYVYGFQSKTKVSPLFSFDLSAYNIRYDGKGDYTLFGATPRLSYEDLSLFLRYLANNDEQNKYGQFFHADAKYKIQEDSFSLTPKAGVIWTTGDTTWPTITYLRSIIVEQSLGAAALKNSEIYNAGFDFQAASLPKALFSLDSYYFKGSASSVPDKGTELNLKAVYQMYKNLELGLAGGYLFANSAYKAEDSRKLQMWFVFKF
ncbi:MAG: hypothetical protein FWD54_05070 [Endomicrobia bacterium]|nr:hypothetical protein [Endomicrobiia bacterium]MCL2799623.1 hypothetical protein [Endomicrobiia bacterium]